MGTVVAAVDATTGFTGQKTVTTAGTPLQMTTNATGLSTGVTVRALAANNGKVYVGFSNTVSSSTGFELSPGESVFLEIKAASVVWLDVSVSGEGACFVAV